MDSEVNGFILTFLFDIFIFIGAFLLWVVLRVQRRDISALCLVRTSSIDYSNNRLVSNEERGNLLVETVEVASSDLHKDLDETNSSNSLDRPFLSNDENNTLNFFSNFTNLALFGRALRQSVLILITSNSKQTKLLSKEAYIYLEFIRLCRNLFAILSILGLGIGLPINLSAPTKSDNPTFFDRAAAENLTMEQPISMWITYVLVWCYSVIFYFHLYRLWQASHFYSKSTTDVANGDRNKLLTLWESHTVLLKGLSKKLHWNDVKHDYGDGEPTCYEKEEIRLCFEAMYPEEIFDVLLVYNPDDRIQCLTEQEHYKYDNEKALNVVNVPKNSAGKAFVIFTSAATASECLMDVRTMQDHDSWETKIVPPLEAISWKNISLDSMTRKYRYLFWNIFIFLVACLIVFPVTLLNELNSILANIFKIFTSNGFFKLITNSFLPPIILVALNSYVVPLLVTFASVRIGYWNKSREISYELHGNIIYLLLTTIFLPLTSLQTLSAVLNFLSGSQKWSEKLGYILLSSSGSFALRYLLNASFLSAASQLLNLFTFGYGTIVAPRLASLRPSEEEDAFFYKQFSFGYWYAVTLSVLTLTLMLSVAVPLLLPLGFVYFFLKYSVDKYNIENDVLTTTHSSGSFTYQVAFLYGYFSVCLFQFCMAGFFMAVGDQMLTIAGTLLFVISTMSITIVICGFLFKPLFINNLKTQTSFEDSSASLVDLELLRDSLCKNKWTKVFADE